MRKPTKNPVRQQRQIHNDAEAEREAPTNISAQGAKEGGCFFFWGGGGGGGLFGLLLGFFFFFDFFFFFFFFFFLGGLGLLWDIGNNEKHLVKKSKKKSSSTDGDSEVLKLYQVKVDSLFLPLCLPLPLSSLPSDTNPPPPSPSRPFYFPSLG